MNFSECENLSDYIQKVYAEKGETFIVIIDEYDVLIREQVGDDEFKPYLGFLNSLFKNAELKPAITLSVNSVLFVRKFNSSPRGLRFL